VDLKDRLQNREAGQKGQPEKVHPSELVTFRLCHGEWFFTLNLAWSGNEWRAFERDGAIRGIPPETRSRDQAAKLSSSHDSSHGDHPIARGVKSVLAPASARIPGSGVSAKA
jgi:hypothetical protein